MTELLAELRSKWSEAAATSSGGREWRAVRLSPSGSMTAFAAVRERDGRIALLLESNGGWTESTRARFETDGVSLSDFRDPADGVGRLALVLEREALREIFEVLAIDLLEVGSSAPTAREARLQLLRRLDAWQACLRARTGPLGRQALIGLFGELEVLRIIANEVGWIVAVDAWGGPTGAVHDFSRGGMSIEVKTVAGIGGRLAISALDQLETVGLTRLLIARLRLRETTEGLSLPSLIDTVRATISTDTPTVLRGFEDLLMRAGYVDVDRPAYASPLFAVFELYGYDVTSEFPRLTRPGVPAGIIEAMYAIDEAGLSCFRLDISELRGAARLMGYAA